MNEYVIRKPFTRKEVTLKTNKMTNGVYCEEDFKEDAETLLDFLQSEVTHGTIRELKKLLEEQRFWKMHNSTKETMEFDVVELTKRISKLTKRQFYTVRLLNGIDEFSMMSTSTTIFSKLNLCDIIEVKVKKDEE